MKKWFIGSVFSLVSVLVLYLLLKPTAPTENVLSQCESKIFEEDAVQEPFTNETSYWCVEEEDNGRMFSVLENSETGDFRIKTLEEPLDGFSALSKNFTLEMVAQELEERGFSTVTSKQMAEEIVHNAQGLMHPQNENVADNEEVFSDQSLEVLFSFDFQDVGNTPVFNWALSFEVNQGSE